jgi:hypothetical protein
MLREKNIKSNEKLSFPSIYETSTFSRDCKILFQKQGNVILLFDYANAKKKKKSENFAAKKEKISKYV